jgi:hypothetical protein
MKRSALWWFFLFTGILAGISLCLLCAPHASASVCDGPEILCPVDTSPAIGGNDGVVVTNDLESPSSILPASSSGTVQPSVCLPFEGCDPIIDTVPAFGVSITLVLTGGMVFPTFLQTGTATGTGSTSSPVEGSGIYSIPEIGAIGPLPVAPVVTPLGPGDVPSTLGAQGNGGPPVISSLPPTYGSEGATPPAGVDGPAPWRSWQPVPPVSNILPAGFIPGATSSVTPVNLVMPASGSSGVETISTVQGSGNIPGPAGVPVTQGTTPPVSANPARGTPMSGTLPSEGLVVSPAPAVPPTSAVASSRASSVPVEPRITPSPSSSSATRSGNIPLQMVPYPPPNLSAPTATYVTRRPDDGAILIRSEIGPPAARQGYEKALLPAIEVGLKGWHRAHSQGAVLGVETSAGILYAPPEVNLVLQAGVEQEIRNIYEGKAADVRLFLRTETHAHPRTLRLFSIEYSLVAVRNGHADPIFQAKIEVQNERDNPEVEIWAHKFQSLHKYLR